MEISKLIEKELIKKNKRLIEAIGYYKYKLKTEKNNIKRIELEEDIKTLQKYL